MFHALKVIADHMKEETVKCRLSSAILLMSNRSFSTEN